MSAASLATGTTVGRYEIRSRLGQGGMGEVYKGYDAALQRHVALKILPPDLVERTDRLQRFIQEARSASALSHPHIITVHEIGEATVEGRALHYIAMELVEGTTLRQEIHVRRAPLSRLLELLAQVADGLAKAHAAGIIHRDLKPDNIMVTGDGYAKIVDFGLAKLIEPRVTLTSESGVATLHKTGERAVLGTVGYMSPEQVEARPVDHRSDIFSFGCILFEAATRRRPFEGDSEIDTLHKIVHEEPRAAPAEVSPPLRRIISRCLAKNPEQRFQSIRDVAADLREAVDAAPPLPAGWRRPAALAVLGAVLIAGAAWLIRNGEDAALEPRIESIVVLPLEPVAGDAEDDYFVDGITEGLTTELAKRGTVTVISRSSAMKYKKSPKPLRDIARELGVEALVRGSVLRAPERLRIDLELVDAATATPLWSGSDERSLGEVLMLQRDLANRIVARIDGGKSTRVSRARAVNPEAYDLYLQGLHLADLSRFSRLRDKAALFEKAIAIDPSFAPPSAALARAYLYASTPGGISSVEGCLKARLAAERALQLDPTLADAHGTLGFLKWACDRDWTISGHHFRRALDLNPNHAETLAEYALYLDMIGRSDEAIATAKRAVGVDPLSWHRLTLGNLYLDARRYDEAIAEFRKNLLANPASAHHQRLIAYALVGKGAPAEAVVAAEKALDMARVAGVTGKFIHGYETTLAFALIAAGERARAEAILRPLRSHDDPPFFLIWAYSMNGELDAAFALVEKELEVGSWANAHALWRTPGLERLRADPRYDALMTRFGLPVEQSEH